MRKGRLKKLALPPIGSRLVSPDGDEYEVYDHTDLHRLERFKRISIRNLCDGTKRSMTLFVLQNSVLTLKPAESSPQERGWQQVELPYGELV